MVINSIQGTARVRVTSQWFYADDLGTRVREGTGLVMARATGVVLGLRRSNSLAAPNT